MGSASQIDLSFTRTHILTSTPTAFFQHSLGTAELIQLLLNSISWTALGRNHILYWGEEINLL